MKKVRAKCGCEGCIFEHEDECPGYEDYQSTDKFEACSENGVQMIFVEGDDEDESRV